MELTAPLPAPKRLLFPLLAHTWAVVWVIVLCSVVVPLWALGALAIGVGHVALWLGNGIRFILEWCGTILERQHED